MLVKTVNIWGAMTTGDDKLIVEEVQTQEYPHETYYVIQEKSYEIQDTYTYQVLPPVLDKFIRLCHAIVKPHEDKLILYGPHLAKQIPSTPICLYPTHYFTTPYELTIVKEDIKMKKLLIWLEKILDMVATKAEVPTFKTSP